MIDLTYLTEMEQEMILSVLKRDANLKKSEEQRVKNLQKQVHDKSKLKYLTGEWFYETKSRRHRDRIHGSDIIRASISGKKPVTILELSQMWSERPSFVNSENQDVYVPPELSGLLEETPEKSKHYYREDGDNLPKESQDMLKRVLPSSSKQRQNPFNSTQLSSATLDETEGQLTNGGIDPTKTPDREFLPSSGGCIAHLTNQKLASYEYIQSAPLPMPKQRTITSKSQDSFTGNNSPSVKQATSPVPRSILKHSPSCFSNDGVQFHPVCCHEPKPHSHQTLLLKPPSMPVREREYQGWIDRKQVRFGPAVGRSSMKWPSKMQDGKEVSEHSLLDLDSTSHPEGEKEIMRLDTSSTNSCTVQDDDGPHKKEMEAWPSLGSPGCLQHSTLDRQRPADLGEGEA
uniref:RabBD domain-containing protein n=1 Tax=Esox lucius TaxID=8010 RepID=A0AAY5KBD6_ESOLU